VQDEVVNSLDERGDTALHKLVYIAPATPPVPSKHRPIVKTSYKTIESTAAQVYRELFLSHDDALLGGETRTTTTHELVATTNHNKRRKLEHQPLMAPSPQATAAEERDKGKDKMMDLELHEEDLHLERDDDEDYLDHDDEHDDDDEYVQDYYDDYDDHDHYLDHDHDHHDDHHYAHLEPHTEEVDSLAAEESSSTGLSAAVSSGAEAVALLLLRAGASCSIQNRYAVPCCALLPPDKPPAHRVSVASGERCRLGETALHVACKRGLTSIVTLLLRERGICSLSLSPQLLVLCLCGDWGTKSSLTDACLLTTSLMCWVCLTQIVT
jgi:hypothetical protein